MATEENKQVGTDLRADASTSEQLEGAGVVYLLVTRTDLGVQLW